MAEDSWVRMIGLNEKRSNRFVKKKGKSNRGEAVVSIEEEYVRGILDSSLYGCSSNDSEKVRGWKIAA